MLCVHGSGSFHSPARHRASLFASSAASPGVPGRPCASAPRTDCAPVRYVVVSIPWGVAPKSASTGVMEDHDRSTRKIGGIHIADGSLVRWN